MKKKERERDVPTLADMRRRRGSGGADRRLRGGGRRCRGEGQKTRLALKYAKRAYVLRTGEIAMKGPAAELLQNEEIRAAYLGG